MARLAAASFLKNVDMIGLRRLIKAVLSTPPTSTSANYYYYLLTRSSCYDNYKGLSGIIGPKSFSSSSSSSNSLSNHPNPKDLSLVVEQDDDHVREERVFRFETSETESMGSTSTSSESGDTIDAKEATVKAMETGLKAGEMGKETLDIVWDAAMGTAHTIKEAVAGDDDHDDDMGKK